MSVWLLALLNELDRRFFRDHFISVFQAARSHKAVFTFLEEFVHTDSMMLT